ncbi:hypothetical protein HZS_3700 [Henneguya salminicola]|nr:hypothetical protein HZS_3700 [Henneguya salminicola]
MQSEDFKNQIYFQLIKLVLNRAIFGRDPSKKKKIVRLESAYSLQESKFIKPNSSDKRFKMQNHCRTITENEDARIINLNETLTNL